MTSPIEDRWRRLEEVTPFCCDAHRELYRAIYFSGAMATMVTLTNWNPEAPDGPLSISPADIVTVAKELAAVYQEPESDAVVPQSGPVHH